MGLLYVGYYNRNFTVFRGRPGRTKTSESQMLCKGIVLSFGACALVSPRYFVVSEPVSQWKLVCLPRV